MASRRVFFQQHFGSTAALGPFWKLAPLATVGVGLAQAMNTLKALESETSDFPLNLPDLGQAVLNSATEHDQ
jgi:hypothetical protein